MKCNKCLSDLASNNNIKCTACGDNLHIACGGLSDADFKRMLPMNVMKWKCPKCKASKKPPTTNTGTPKSPVILLDQQDDDNERMPSIVSIDTRALLSNMNEKFRELSREMADLKNSFNVKLDALSGSIEFWSSKFQLIEEAVTKVQAEVVAVKEENVYLRTQINLLNKTMDEQEQKSRQCNVELQNLPEKKSENLMHIALAMGKVLDVPISHDCIKAAHRVAQNVQSDRPKNIIIELSSRRLRDDMIAAARARRGLTAGQLLRAAGGSLDGVDERQASRPIFLNEHLTLKNKILYSNTRKEASAKKYKFVWIKNAAILVRKEDNSRVIRIRCEADLKKL